MKYCILVRVIGRYWTWKYSKWFYTKSTHMYHSECICTLPDHIMRCRPKHVSVTNVPHCIYPGTCMILLQQPTLFMEVKGEGCGNSQPFRMVCMLHLSS